MKYRRSITMKFSLIILVVCLASIRACNFSVSVKQELWMEGFHRNMTYDIDMGAALEGDAPRWLPYIDCIISIHQSLPSGIYANPDELIELKRSHGVEAFTRKIDTEVAAHHAQTSAVYIMKRITGPNLKVWVPVHARYHKAVTYGGYALNEIEEPKLFMRCPDSRLANCARPLATITFLCTSTAKEKCPWNAIPFDMRTETPIKWQTPVGDLNHYYPVAVITTLAVTFGSIYLLLTIHEYKPGYNH